MIRFKLRFLSVACVALAASLGFSQNVWTPAEKGIAASDATAQRLLDYSVYRLNVIGLRQELDSAPNENLNIGILGREILLPMPDGRMQRFRIVNAPIISGQAAKVLKGFSTYAGQGLDDPYATARLDMGPMGFHGMVLSPHGDFMIDPVAGDITSYISYFKKDYTGPTQFKCLTSADTHSNIKPGISLLPVALTTLKTYRLAMNTTIEFTASRGGVAAAQTAAAVGVNRVTGVYERDLGIRLNMTYLKCWSGSDPYTNTDVGTMLAQNQTECDTTVGNANYDIGHAMGTGDGGVVSGQVGVTGTKARGCTGSPSPVGDPFYIDYVAHEMGHQFNADHTFNGTTGSCGGGNRVSSSAYEPGSGTTIMAYAGICGSEDVQSNSDAYFHTRSYDQIIAWRNGASSGGTSASTTNNAPVANAGADFTIPQSTPFRLTGSGTDSDGDALTFCWEQFNTGTASPTTNNATRPLFRSRNPLTIPTRFFPQLSDVLSGAATPWEILPNVNRSMTFRMTTRDNRVNGGGSAYDSTVITVSGAAFVVTAPNTAVNWAGGTTQTVTWTVGGGSVSPNVNILLSTNGGASYGTGGATVLLANTPNDGSQQITVPNNVNSTQCRIIVEAASSVFFDVSNANFTITPGSVTVVPNAYTIAAGIYKDGTVASLISSDDTYLTIRRFRQPDSGPFMQLVVEGISTQLTASQIVMLIETSTTHGASVPQTIEAWNFITNAWVTVDTATVGLTDAIRTATISSNATNFIQSGTGLVRLKIGVSLDVFNGTRSVVSVDQVKWTISP